MPPIEPPPPNLGEDGLSTTEISIDDPHFGPSELRREAAAQFNLTWLGPELPAEPEEQAFLIRIGHVEPDGFHAVKTVHAFVPWKKEGSRYRYRVAVEVPDDPGHYVLRFQRPDTIIHDLDLFVE